MLNSEHQVLVAEDNPAQARVVAFVLKRAGCAVTIAHDGDAAWRLLNQQEFDLMVSDIVMPGITGNELCELMRKDKRLAKVPVILLTAKFLDSSAAACYLEPPVQAVLAKPLSPRKLESAISECFAACVGSD